LASVEQKGELSLDTGQGGACVYSNFYDGHSQINHKRAEFFKVIRGLWIH